MAGRADAKANEADPSDPGSAAIPVGVEAEELIRRLFTPRQQGAADAALAPRGAADGDLHAGGNCGRRSGLLGEDVEGAGPEASSMMRDSGSITPEGALVSVDALKPGNSEGSLQDNTWDLYDHDQRTQGSSVDISMLLADGSPWTEDELSAEWATKKSESVSGADSGNEGGSDWETSPDNTGYPNSSSSAFSREDYCCASVPDSCDRNALTCTPRQLQNGQTTGTLQIPKQPFEPKSKRRLWGEESQPAVLNISQPGPAKAGYGGGARLHKPKPRNMSLCNSVPVGPSRARGRGICVTLRGPTVQADTGMREPTEQGRRVETSQACSQNVGSRALTQGIPSAASRGPSIFHRAGNSAESAHQWCPNCKCRLSPCEIADGQWGHGVRKEDGSSCRWEFDRGRGRLSESRVIVCTRHVTWAGASGRDPGRRQHSTLDGRPVDRHPVIPPHLRHYRPPPCLNDRGQHQQHAACEPGVRSGNPAPMASRRQVRCSDASCQSADRQHNFEAAGCSVQHRGPFKPEFDQNCHTEGRWLVFGRFEEQGKWNGVGTKNQDGWRRGRGMDQFGGRGQYTTCSGSSCSGDRLSRPRSMSPTHTDPGRHGWEGHGVNTGPVEARSTVCLAPRDGNNVGQGNRPVACQCTNSLARQESAAMADGQRQCEKGVQANAEPSAQDQGAAKPGDCSNSEATTKPVLKYLSEDRRRGPPHSRSNFAAISRNRQGFGQSVSGWVRGPPPHSTQERHPRGRTPHQNEDHHRRAVSLSPSTIRGDSPRSLSPGDRLCDCSPGRRSQGAKNGRYVIVAPAGHWRRPRGPGAAQVIRC
ncbi:unnamed protein product [Ostreobium quekettii]|uniref:Uncharacterized protein n=1 Tax=Ostreobium quekettii TaxID=121088 RepID=A0A8S1IL18_9CHLO|nr:unnamed protein product [Ostreobium quekettii]